MGIAVRDNLGMADGFFLNDREHQLQVIRKIRQYRPDIVLANAIHDRHPDHGRGSEEDRRCSAAVVSNARRGPEAPFDGADPDGASDATRGVAAPPPS